MLRQGLPSAVGESLLKSADYEIYVRDRSPQAHFAGRAYVLPRQGQKGAPLVTVNTAKVSIDVYRIGDRNLLATVNRDDFLKPIDSSRAEEIASQDGAKVWSGTMDVASAAQPGRRDRLSGARRGRQARARRLCHHRAAVEGRGEPGRFGRGRERAARGAMDGGLRPRPDRDLRRRRRACARRNRWAPPRRSPASSSGSSRATTKCWRRRRPAPTGGSISIPGLSRGKGGSAPGLLVATLAGDYGFLSLAQNAFDLTDRGVAGRDPPAGLDAFLYTERGVYRSGETVFATALLRDSKGVGEIRPAADARRQAAGRRRIQARDAARRGPRRPRLRHTAAARFGGGKMVDRGLRRSEGRQHRPGRVPARGLHSRAARFHSASGEADHRSRRTGRVLARRAVSLWRAGERARRHRRDSAAGRRRRGARRLSRLCRRPRRR